VCLDKKKKERRCSQNSTRIILIWITIQTSKHKTRFLRTNWVSVAPLNPKFFINDKIKITSHEFDSAELILWILTKMKIINPSSDLLSHFRPPDGNMIYVFATLKFSVKKTIHLLNRSSFDNFPIKTDKKNLYFLFAFGLIYEIYKQTIKVEWMLQLPISISHVLYRNWSNSKPFWLSINEIQNFK
jgi:hypothetical protein